MLIPIDAPILEKALRQKNFRKYCKGGCFIEWWTHRINLGDYLSVPVAEYMLSLNGIDYGKAKKNKKKYGHLFVIGSVIGYKTFDSAIWGTGVLNLKQAANVHEQSAYRRYDIRAVRGPLTKRVLEAAGYKVPEVFGDPAILMPKIYSPSSVEKKYDVSVIFHFRYARQLEDMHTISMETKDYQKVIDEIVASKRVISSSLHGIILAESYGIPAVLLCESKEEDLFKYYDYYYGTGRYNVRIAWSLEEALNTEPMELPQNLDALREGLIKSFPADLWIKG